MAILNEAAETARSYRHDPGRPLVGYVLVTIDRDSIDRDSIDRDSIERDSTDRDAGGRECGRTHIFLENGETLTSRTADGSFYYEAWIVTDGLPVSLGAFNTSLTGEGTAGAIRPLSELATNEAKGIRITAEPFGGSPFGHTSVLEGPLLWLAGGPAREALAAAPVEASSEVPVPAFASPPAREPWPGQGAWSGEGQIPAAAAPAAASAPPVATQVVDARQPESAAVQPTAGRSAAVKMEELRLEPAPAESGAPAPSAPGVLTLSAPLAGRHPMAPRAAGHAVLHKHPGSLTITVRGLPTPPSLGRDPTTDRPFTAYRVWLMQQRTGSKLPLGHCVRVWGDNFRFESEGGLPLGRYDTIVITADDRTAPSPNPGAPQVLAGSYNAN
jgi:hypothetical protein